MAENSTASFMAIFSHDDEFFLLIMKPDFDEFKMPGMESPRGHNAEEFSPFIEMNRPFFLKLFTRHWAEQ